MNRFKKFLFAVAVACFGSFCALAEATANTTVNTAMQGWIADVEATMSTWAGSLSPLFTLGITILLIVIAWRLFKRVTKTAS